ncbi:hypothetical protein NXS19_004671 [Fusarium pseudograminearum]|nr:hypothetical protein NXS19_004671 [Fusarium pseudograminearum]
MVSIVDNSSLEEKLSFNRYRVNDAMADGEGVIVYVMDSGHNPDPQSDTDEQIFFPGKVEFPQQDGDFKPTTEPRKLTDDLFKKANPKFKVVGEPTGTEVRDDSKGQHGPSMSALIGASKVGVAPGAASRHFAVQSAKSQTSRSASSAARQFSPTTTRSMLGSPPSSIARSLSHTRTCLRNLRPMFQKAVESLVNAGMIIVASGGNQKHTTNTTWAEWKADQGKTDPMFRAPQCFDNVIVVGGLGRDGKVWKESGTGKLVKHYVLADQVENPFNDSSSITGTSVAAAFLSGIIACILSSAQYKAKAQANVDDARKHIRQILEKVSEDFDDGNGNKCRAFMAGTIDLKNVVWEYKV